MGELSTGYSASDIDNVVKDAVMMPLRKCHSAKAFKKTEDGGWEPTYPSDPEAVAMTPMEIEPPSLLRAPKVCMDDFMGSLQTIKPSVCEDDLGEYIKWTETFG